MVAVRRVDRRDRLVSGPPGLARQELRHRHDRVDDDALLERPPTVVRARNRNLVLVPVDACAPDSEHRVDRSGAAAAHRGPCLDRQVEDLVLLDVAHVDGRAEAGRHVVRIGLDHVTTRPDAERTPLREADLSQSCAFSKPFLTR